MLIRQQVVRVKSAAPLYSRIAEDLHLGGMSQRTHDGYLRAVRQLADYCKTAPNKITESQLRRYFLFLENEKKFAYGSLRVAYSGFSSREPASATDRSWPR
ncbi:MAG: phage integrase N-terminal SAM-like domain-containing protein [Planctomycetes bacterium]|nr:phage integrase N-terminal SAM-like domain-containing protein [Planctomycetota bacterium]